MSNSIFEGKQSDLILHRVVIPAGGSSNPAELMSGVLEAGYQLVSVQANPGIVGSTSCAFNIGKVTGSTPMGSATSLLSATVNCVSSQDITLSGTLIGSQTLQQLAAGDRVVLQKSGYWPVTAIVGVTCVLKRS